MPAIDRRRRKQWTLRFGAVLMRAYERAASANRRRLEKRRATKEVTSEYQRWLSRYDAVTGQSCTAYAGRAIAMSAEPRIAIVMPIYNPPLAFLQAAVESVRSQIYPHWELCIADDASTDAAVVDWLQRQAAQDARIRVVTRTHNGHICAASNSALELVGAPYVAFLDQDDVLAAHALLLVAQVATQRPFAQLIYSDEDKLGATGLRREPHFKPDWNPELLLSQNYVCHLLVVKTDLVRRLGGFRLGYEGAQDHDLVLRCAEAVSPEEVVHIPHVLYHWRQHPASTSVAGSAKPYAQDAGARAISDHLRRRGVASSVEPDGRGWYRPRLIPGSDALRVSVIVIGREPELVRECIGKLIAVTIGVELEVLHGVDGESHGASHGDPRIRTVPIAPAQPLANWIGVAVSESRHDHVVLIESGIEPIADDWLIELVAPTLLPGVAAVGPRIFDAKCKAWRTSLVLGGNQIAGWSLVGPSADDQGYMGRARLLQRASVVAPHCVLLERSDLASIGGFAEDIEGLSGIVLDICMKLRHLGRHVVWTPYSTVALNPSRPDQANWLLEDNDASILTARWKSALLQDPHYNPNLALDPPTFGLSWPPRGKERRQPQSSTEAVGSALPTG